MNELLSKLAACIVCTCFFCLATYKSMGAMQQSGYKNSKFKNWIIRKDNLYYNRLTLWTVMILFTPIVTALAFSFMGKKAALIISGIPFLLFCVLFYIADRKFALKIPVNNTGRLKRLCLTYSIFIFIVSFSILSLCRFVSNSIDSDIYYYFQYFPFSIMPLLLPWILCVANAFNSIFENNRNKKYIKRSEQVLDDSNIIRVGIVGSYGKTSVKNILYNILSQKYRVVCTPESYNTPIGIARTVLSDEFKNKDLFIAEMGARNIGDIKELSLMVKPDYSIFIGVCPQHIQTFKNENNILKAKSEIITGTKNKILCGEDLKDKIVNLPLDVLSVSNKEKCVYADFSTLIKNLQIKKDGTSFDLYLPKINKSIKVDTPLLGVHSAENIALSALLALELGLDEKQIEKGIQNISPIPHRLELIKYNDINILDDSYNGNTKGVVEAINAIKRFEGRKIVVTPGLIETGIMDEQINIAVGRELVGLDMVILVGDTLVQLLKKGYIEAGGNIENLFIVPNLEKAKIYFSKNLKKGDTVLFLNDLPDVY